MGTEEDRFDKANLPLISRSRRPAFKYGNSVNATYAAAAKEVISF